MRRFASVILVVMCLMPSIIFAQDDANPQARLRVDQAMQHLSNYLELETAISLTRIEADDENIPFTSYSWTPVVYTTAAMGCPQAGQTYASREVPAYRILITIRGYGTYDYRVSADGGVVLLCLGGRPSDTSINLAATTAGTVGAAPSRTSAAPGLVGGLARVDQAMRHVSAYLNLRSTITLAAVQADDPFIAVTEFTWKPIWYSVSGNNCPVPSDAYLAGLQYGYEIVLKVNSRSYTYYSNQDGSLLVLCIGGRPHSSSVGLSQ